SSLVPSAENATRSAAGVLISRTSCPVAASHSLRALKDPESTRVLSGEKATDLTVTSLRVCASLPLAASHRRTLLSSVSRRVPSGEVATESTEEAYRSKAPSSCRLATSQSLNVRDNSTETARATSRETATTRPSRGLKLRTGWPVSTLQSSSPLSWSAVSARVPSAENAKRM